MTPAQRHARWKAQHASQHLTIRRRKPMVMHGPVAGDASFRPGDTVSMDVRGRERACRCGFVVCAKRGPCAPAPVRAPESVAAPRFVVGQRVRVATTSPIARGKDGVIESLDGYAGGLFRVRVGGDVACYDHADRRHVGCRNIHPEHLEPAPSPAPVEAWTPPGSWTQLTDRPGRVQWSHESDASAWLPDNRSTWVWAAGDTDFATCDDCKPTLAQACCAALGIEIVRCVDGETFFATHGTALLVDGNYDLDAESCARAALAAHARAVKP